jgi:selenocysteine lyase/cysteine desulfurase
MMPFSVKDVVPDFMVSVGYKWLMGPYSFSYAYVAPRHHGGQPLEENWIARKDSENFTALVDYTDQYQSGARRFDMGERSNHMLSPIAINCLQQILDWGVDEISAYLKTLTDYAAKKAQKLDLSVVEDRYRSPHFMGINFEGGVPEELIESLRGHKIYVAARGTNIRVAPHVFNDKSDIDRLFAVIAEFL